MMLKVIRNIFLHLSDCSLCIGLIPMGVLFLLEDNVVTSVVILIGRESVFSVLLAECRTVSVAWLVRCASLNLAGQVLVIAEATTNMCAVFTAKRTSRGWNLVQSVLTNPSPDACLCLPERGSFCNPVRHYSGSGHVLTSEQRWDRLIPTWTKWSEVEERTVGVPLSEDRKRDARPAKTTTSKPWQNEAACSWKHVLYITSSQKFD